MTGAAGGPCSALLGGAVSDFWPTSSQLYPCALYIRLSMCRLNLSINSSALRNESVSIATVSELERTFVIISLADPLQRTGTGTLRILPFNCEFVRKESST